jgi:osmotically inducible protein OsmC
MAEDGAHKFRVTATWNPGEKKGRLESENAVLACAHAGAPELGGIGGAANPEELLAAAVSACFVQTWAIFLEKLKVPIEEPRVAAACTIEKDPAGGFRVTRIAVAPHVPASLWESRRADVAKTLQLAEKYCIVSKAVRGDGSVVSVKPEVV